MSGDFEALRFGLAFRLARRCLQLTRSSVGISNGLIVSEMNQVEHGCELHPIKPNPWSMAQNPAGIHEWMLFHCRYWFHHHMLRLILGLTAKAACLHPNRACHLDDAP